MIISENLPAILKTGKAKTFLLSRVIEIDIKFF